MHDQVHATEVRASGVSDYFMPKSKKKSSFLSIMINFSQRRWDLILLKDVGV